MNSLPSERYLAVKVVMMPRDTNAVGTIFGGVLLSYLDQAGAVGARHEIGRAGWPEATLVTVAMTGVEFHQPVFVGDVVSFWTRVVRVGTTSISVHVSVETERGGRCVNLTEGQVVYVSVEAAGPQRRPLPLRGAS